MNPLNTSANKFTWSLAAGALVGLLQQWNLATDFVVANFDNAEFVWKTVMWLAMGATTYFVPNKE